MKTAFAACFLTFACIGSSPHADAKTDASFIASQTATRAVFETAINAQRPMIAGAIENELRNNGITLTDPVRFVDLMMSEIMTEFVEIMQKEMATIYLDNFSEQQLEEIVRFFRSEAGQAYLIQTPALMAEGAKTGERAAQIAFANSGKRLAQKIEDEGLIVVDDPSMLSQLLEMLRQ
ncbi:MAG: DUF2059 domain-containing protein [Pseudomonadota bacterium]